MLTGHKPPTKGFTPKLIVSVCAVVVATVLFAEILIRMMGSPVSGAGLTATGLSGTYAGGKGTSFDKMVFKSNEVVELTVAGQVKKWTFRARGKGVEVTGEGKLLLFVESDPDWLRGDRMTGNYYLIGKDPTRMFGTYAASNHEIIRFKPDGSMVFTSVQGGNVSGTYVSNGKTVTISLAPPANISGLARVLTIDQSGNLTDPSGKAYTARGN